MILTLESHEARSLHMVADGLVTEVQAQLDPFIYARVVIEMAMLQRQEVDRTVQGVVLFFHETLDPRTEPWNAVVRAFYLDQVLARLATREPDHPLVALFQPVLQTDDLALERSAAACYNRIKSSPLPTPTIETLLAVFVNWLEQRFFERGKQEIEAMLLGELPDLRETQSGKDLIAIGRSEGRIEGKAEGKIEGRLEGIIEGKLEGKTEGLLLFLAARFGDLDPELRRRIESVTSPQLIDRLLVQAATIESVDRLTFE